jgi:predicted metalloprotease with PDZ domain
MTSTPSNVLANYNSIAPAAKEVAEKLKRPSCRGALFAEESLFSPVTIEEGFFAELIPGPSGTRNDERKRVFAQPGKPFVSGVNVLEWYHPSVQGVSYEGGSMIAFLRTNALLSVTVFVAILFSAGRIDAQTPAGPIRLEVDETRAPQKILHTHLQMPVKPGPLDLYYPEWIPGEHMPTGPIIDMAGLKITGAGKALAWRRDLVDMFAFHLDVPQGVTSLDINFDFLLSAPKSGYSAGASATAYLNVLSWNQLVLYPKGYDAANLTFVPSLRLPAEWKFGTALPGAKQNGDTIDFSPVSLETLVDSPVLTGRYFRAIDLTPGQNPPHELDIAADSPGALAMSPEMESHFRQLVAETGVLFGSRHYRDYHFLLTLSDGVAHFGLEHHESSDDRTWEGSLIDDSKRIVFSGLLPHEFVHSWNGKYRRPAGLISQDYHEPMKDELLWVYEGLTSYLGGVLTARSGLFTPEQSREEIATFVDIFENRKGREWRPLQDTADSAVFLYNADPEWADLRRGTDFYNESQLLWLDVDSTLRRLTGDRKSMNDFCRAFHGGDTGVPDLKTYSFDDVVAGLNSVALFDWAGFLRTRLDSIAPRTPSESIENSGWKIVYNDQPNQIRQVRDSVRKEVTLMSSIGLLLAEDGTVIDVFYNGQSFKAGIGPGMKIQAVNGREYSPAILKEAIQGAENLAAPMQLIVANGSQVETHSVDYHGGLHYPHLVRDPSHPDFLSEILRPQAK